MGLGLAYRSTSYFIAFLDVVFWISNNTLLDMFINKVQHNLCFPLQTGSVTL